MAAPVSLSVLLHDVHDVLHYLDKLRREQLDLKARRHLRRAEQAAQRVLQRLDEAAGVSVREATSDDADEVDAQDDSKPADPSP